MIKEEFDYIAHGPVKGPPAKLVILLHGYGVNAAYMERMAKAILDRMPDALVLCPQAPSRMDLPAADEHKDLAVPPPEEATSPPEGLSPDSQREWFRISRSPAEMNDALLQIAKKMNDFIDRKRGELGIRDRDIAIMGFSQGGAVALYAACTRQRAIGCAVGHSTIIVDTGDFSARPPVLLVYGTNDKSFSVAEYKLRSILPLRGFLPDLEVAEIAGMGHTTNRNSRDAVAGFIARKLGGPG